MEPPQKGRNHALPWFGRPVSEITLTTGEKGKKKARAEARSKGKGKEKKGSGGGRRFGSNKSGSGESRGQKRANQRCNRRFFRVLPETRPTGETTRTKTDGSLSSEISDSGNERTNKGKSGVTPDGIQTKQTKRERRGASS